MEIIFDGYSHFLPKTFVEALILAYPTDELRGLTGLDYFSDLESRVRVLDKFTIDRQILTLARANIWINMPMDIALKMTCIANDTLSRASQKFPDRFIPVGTLPMLSEAFMPEFDRCIEELGMVGIQVFSNIEGKFLDDPEFRWFFSKANGTRIPVGVQPQVQREWSPEFALDKILGWPFDTSLVMSRLVFSGIMEEYPYLRIITHHMGGMIPFFSERIKGSYEGRELFTNAKFVSLTKDPIEYFRRFYGDTVLNGSVHGFECGYKFLGPEHIVFGTDYPFGPQKGERWIEGALQQIKVTDLPQTEKTQILGGNLKRLIE